MPNSLSIHLSNPSQIQNYIQNLIPNNPQNLHRIHKQLQLFSQKFNNLMKNKSKSQKLLKQNQIKDQDNKERIKIRLRNELDKKKGSGHMYFQKNKQSNINQRQEKLLRSLRQKGIRPLSDQIQLGHQIIQNNQLKIIKPLQKNSSLGKTQSDLFVKCIKRYNLNRQVYDNQLQDGKVDSDRFNDRDMKQFIQRRNSSLSQIIAKQEFGKSERIKNGKNFSHIQSKLHTLSTRSLGLNTLRKCQTINQNPSSTQSSNYITKRKQESNELIDECTKALQQKRLKQIDIQKQPFRITIEKKKDQQIREIMNLLGRKLDGDHKQPIQQKFDLKQLVKKTINPIQRYNAKYLKSIKSMTKNDTIILNNRNDLTRNYAKYINLVVERAK